MVEQGCEPLFEQRQPMLHPRQPPAVADRLVEWIAGGIGPEFLAIGGAEALDAIGVEQYLAGRHQGEGGGLARRFLVGRVEMTHRLNLVAEEIKADRLRRACRVKIDDRPAHRIFARVVNRVAPLIAIGLKQFGEPVAVDRHAFLQHPRELADAEWRQHALGGGVDGRDQHLRAGQRLLQRVERRHPLGHHPQRRTGAVVGQAVPGREADHLHLGREGGDGVGQRPHRRFVGSDDHQAATRTRAKGGARKVGGEPRQESGRNRGQGQRRLGGEDGAERGGHLAIRMKSSCLSWSIIGP